MSASDDVGVSILVKLLTEHETLAAHLLAGEDHLRLFEVVNALGKRQGFV